VFGQWRRGHPAPSAAPVPPQQDPPPDSAASDTDALAADLKALIRRVNAAGGRLPVGAVPAVRAIEDRLRPLLTYLAGQPPRSEVLRRISAVIREYLPEAVDAYLMLPARYATAPSSPAGTTPADDLLAQLARLTEAADQLQSDVYEHDARQLAIQRQFLDSKFHRSELDL